MKIEDLKIAPESKFFILEKGVIYFNGFGELMPLNDVGKRGAHEKYLRNIFSALGKSDWYDYIAKILNNKIIDNKIAQLIDPYKQLDLWGSLGDE